jgi:hypothetical protein
MVLHLHTHHPSSKFWSQTDSEIKQRGGRGRAGIDHLALISQDRGGCVARTDHGDGEPVVREVGLVASHRSDPDSVADLSHRGPRSTPCSAQSRVVPISLLTRPQRWCCLQRRCKRRSARAPAFIRCAATAIAAETEVGSAVEYLLSTGRS